MPPSSEVGSLPAAERAASADLIAAASRILAAHGISTARLDAELLLANALGLDRPQLYIRTPAPIPASACSAFWTSIARRNRREPLAYITGVQEFWSLEFRVNREVLIPRPETELLVETALSVLRGSTGDSSVLDLGTGSGCIAVSLATEVPRLEVWASDVSPGALAVAAENTKRHRVADRITLMRGDMFAPFRKQRKRFALIVSNPPYIAQPEFAELQAEVLDWEPRGALDGGRDGLDVYRRVLEGCPRYLQTGGTLLLEIGHTQKSALGRLVEQQPGLIVANCFLDHAARPRVLAVRKTAPGDGRPNTRDR